MSTPEPKTCGVVANGKICGDWAMYKIGSKGFCEKHKPAPQVVLANNPPRQFAPHFRPHLHS